jgi:hypothetical protein
MVRSCASRPFITVGNPDSSSLSSAETSLVGMLAGSGAGRPIDSPAGSSVNVSPAEQDAATAAEIVTTNEERAPVVLRALDPIHGG